MQIRPLNSENIGHQILGNIFKLPGGIILFYLATVHFLCQEPTQICVYLGRGGCLGHWDEAAPGEPEEGDSLRGPALLKGCMHAGTPMLAQANFLYF